MPVIYVQHVFVLFIFYLLKKLQNVAENLFFTKINLKIMCVNVDLTNVVLG